MSRSKDDFWAIAIMAVLVLPLCVWLHSCASNACHRRGGQYVAIGRSYTCFRNGTPIETWGDE